MHLPGVSATEKWKIPNYSLYYPNYHGGYTRLRHNRIARLWWDYKFKKRISEFDMRIAFAQWTSNKPMTAKEVRTLMGERCSLTAIETSMWRMSWYTNFPRDPEGSWRCRIKYLPKRVALWMAKYGDKDTICFLISMMSRQGPRYNYVALADIQHYALRSHVNFYRMREALRVLKAACIVKERSICKSRDGREIAVIEFSCKAGAAKRVKRGEYVK